MPSGRPLSCCVERQRDRRLAGDVEDRGARGEVRPSARTCWSSGRRCSAGRWSPIGSGGCGERRRQERVVVRRPGGERAGDAVQLVAPRAARRTASIARARAATAPSSAAPCRRRVGSRPRQQRRGRRSTSRRPGRSSAREQRPAAAARPRAARTSSTSWPRAPSSAAASRAAVHALAGRARHSSERRCASSARSAGRPGSRAARCRRRARAAAAPRRRRRARGPASTSSSSAVSRDRAREDAVLDEELLAQLRRQRDAAALRLEADEPAAGRRDAQSSRRRRCRGRAAPSPRRPRPPTRPTSRPGVRARSHGLRVGPEARGLGDREDAQLRQRRWCRPRRSPPRAAAASTLWS